MKWISFAVCVLLEVAFVAGAEESKVTLPDCAVGVIEIASPDTLRDNIKAYVDTVVPGNKLPPLQNILYGQIIRSYNPGLVDGVAPFRIFIVKAPREQLRVVAVFKAKGVAAFRRTLLPQLKKVEEKDGITYYTEMQDVEVPYAITEVEDTIICGNGTDSIPAIREYVMEGKLGVSRILPEKADAGAYVDFSELNKFMSGKPGGLAGFLKNKETKEPPLDDPKREELRKRLEEIDVDEDNALLQQTDWISASVHVTASGITMRAEGAPKGNSLLSQLIMDMTVGVPDVLKYIPIDSQMTFALGFSNIDPYPEISKKKLDLEKQLVRLVAPNLDLSIMDANDEPVQIASGITPGEYIGGIIVERVKHPEISLKRSDLEPWETLADERRDEPNPEDVQMTDSKTEYKDHMIHQADYKFLSELPKDIGPNDEVPDSVMNRWLFGSSFSEASLIIDHDVMIARGPDALQTIKGVIDGHPSIMTDKAFKEFTEGLPSDTIILCKMELPRLVLAYSKVLASMSPVFAKMPEFGQGPGITIVIRKNDGKPTGEMVIPAAEVKVIVDGFKKSFEQQKPQN